jgi:hypothetical protein
MVRDRAHTPAKDVFQCACDRECFALATVAGETLGIVTEIRADILTRSSQSDIWSSQKCEGCCPSFCRASPMERWAPIHAVVVQHDRYGLVSDVAAPGANALQDQATATRRWRS